MQYVIAEVSIESAALNDAGTNVGGLVIACLIVVLILVAIGLIFYSYRKKVGTACRIAAKCLSPQ